MNIDVIADLHGYYPQMEGGDLLIVAGDLTASDTHAQYLHFYSWLHKQKYKHYIFIAGNHDVLIEKDEVLLDSLHNTTYLCDSGTEYEGLKIWGSPFTLKFSGQNPSCMAFTVDHDDELADKWKMIPDDTDILITHTPCFGLHDAVFDPATDQFRNTGSPSLGRWLHNHKDTLKLHVCGHIHEAYGINDFLLPYSCNASIMDRLYRPVHQPIRVMLDKHVDFRLNDQDGLSS